MPQVSTYKNFVMIVDENLIGPKQRRNNPSAFHPMLRDAATWESFDKLRAVLGRYKTVYRGSKGYFIYNYAGALDLIQQGILPGAWDGGSNGIGRLRNQLMGANDGTNIVFDYRFVEYGNGVRRLILEHGEQEKMVWNNNYSLRDPSSTSYLANLANFVEYVQDGIQMDDTEPLLENIIDVPILDHSAVIYLTDADSIIRKASGLDLGIDPVYNFYASTTPPYELVSGMGAQMQSSPSAARIKEYHLPNVYFLETELRNTGSVLLATYHEPALTLDNTVDWFQTQIGIAQTVTTEVEDRFYDVYSEGLQQLGNSSDEYYSGVDFNLSLNNKNFAILHSDLGALEEERVTSDSLPFYNKITLGNDLSEVSGKESNLEIFHAIANNEETKDFIDILQMETILRLTTSMEENLGDREFKSMVKKFHSNPEEDPTDYNYTVANEEYKLLYDLRDLMEDYEDGNRDVIVSNLINTFTSMNPDVQYIGIDASQLPFRLIRDYQIPEEERFIDYQQASNAYVEMFEAEESLGYVPRVIRTLEEVFTNTNSHVETLLYVIKKKDSPNGEPIQTYYVSPHFSDSASARSYFYDTQVKYGKEYYYEFQKVVAIFGNEYEYLNPQVNTNSNFTVNRLMVDYENEMSIKIALVPYMIPSTGIQTLILDKPPVPPEVSFYSYHGIDNKVKILLNSSTGEFEAKPVIINEQDKNFFINEYRSQTQDFATPDDDVLQKKITFKSDDPVDRYQLFKLDTKPQSYAEFANTQILIDPAVAIPGDITDTIEPNRKYYYCARSLDVHDNLSNPGHIYEIEIVNNNGQIFLRQQVMRYEVEQPTYNRAGRRFLYIEPTFQQATFPPENESMITVTPGLGNAPDSNLLGEPGVDKIWDKSFKVRVTSKKTGRKMDLNLTFKNSGITNTSE